MWVSPHKVLLMKRIILIILTILLVLPSYSHPWKPSNYVIVDTDGGVDDMKTLCMLLASNDVRVLAVTISPGVLNTGTAYVKVKSMLNSFYHEGIPVGINRIATFRSPDMSLPLNYRWGDETGIDPAAAPGCFEIIGEMLKVEKTKIRFISLGSLSTAYEAFKSLPVFREQVKEIIWSSVEPRNTSDFNYKADRESAAGILDQDVIPVSVIKAFNGDGGVFYNNEFLESIKSAKTIYADKISGFLSSTMAKDHKFSIGAFDEMIAVFLHYPDLFTSSVSGKTTAYTPSSSEKLRDNVITILKGETVAGNQVIREMPDDPSFYADDIAPYVKEIIEKHGHDEWNSGVIANEMHRHLGVFAIIGVKMGIRAREYFNTGVDEFHALSFAGSVPPMSCMNDGLLVSTGATPGHGLLTISDNPQKNAAAEFTYLNRKIRVSLRPEIENKVFSELKEFNFVYGLDSDIYWELVRQNTIKYWINFDRHEIFLIEEL